MNQMKWSSLRFIQALLMASLATLTNACIQTAPRKPSFSVVKYTENRNDSPKDKSSGDGKEDGQEDELDSDLPSGSVGQDRTQEEIAEGRLELGKKGLDLCNVCHAKGNRLDLIGLNSAVIPKLDKAKVSTIHKDDASAIYFEGSLRIGLEAALKSVK